MKISFSTVAFAEAAKAIRTVASIRDVEIMGHALLHATGGCMTMTMAAFDVSARVMLDCETDGRDLLVSIPGPVLDFFIARADQKEGGSLDFDEAMRNVIARQGEARMTVGILPGDAFPSIADVETAWSFTIRANEICELFRTCQKAISEDAAYPYLEGIFLHRADCDLAAIATDRHRLHLVAIAAPDLQGDMPQRAGASHPGIIVPRSTIGHVLKLFGDDESEINVSGTAGLILFQGERLRLASKLIDGTFPNYPPLMVEGGPNRITVDARTLDAAIGGLLVMPDTDPKGRKLVSRAVRMTPDGDELLLEMKGTNGEIQDRIACKTEGSGNPMVFQAHYLRDLIGAAGEGDITFAPSTTRPQAVPVYTRRDDASFLLLQRQF